MLLADQHIAHSNKSKPEHEHYKTILQKTFDLIQEGINRGIFRNTNPLAASPHYNAKQHGA